MLFEVVYDPLRKFAQEAALWLRAGPRPMAAACTRRLFGGLLARPAASPLRTLVARMSVLKSQAVRQWIGDRAIESPTEWRPWKWQGRWQGPQIGRKRQQLLVKEAIRRGDIMLEPTVMVPPPKFRGHKSERNRPIRRAEVAAKMQEMPKLIAEYLRERRNKRTKERVSSRWK